MIAPKPKKSLGQHFLQDENIARKIVASLKGEGVGNIIEVGAGRGVLTKYLFQERRYSVSAIEIDQNNVEFLRSVFPDYKNNIIHKDILQYHLQPERDKYAVIGNFPYNMSSQIFFWILKNRDQISEVVCMVQKEVAERISSGPGVKTYGILSVLLQAYFDIYYLFTVSPKVFYPRPEVYSAVIRLERNKERKLDCDEDLFVRVVRTCFNQRRKMIRNSIKKIYSGALPEDTLMHKRPEQLEIQQFVDMTKRIQVLI